MIALSYEAIIALITSIHEVIMHPNHLKYVAALSLPGFNPPAVVTRSLQRTLAGSPHFPVLSEQQRDVFKETTDWLAKYNP